MEKQKLFIKTQDNIIKQVFIILTENLNKLEIQRNEFLEEKEVQDHLSLEFSRYINIDVPLSVSRLSIIPDQEDAPSSVISTLSRRFLDLQAVRAEVMLMTFEITIDILIPVHIYLLSNYEYDYRVKPPSIKTCIQIIKKTKLIFSRGWGRERRRKRRKIIYSDNGKLIRVKFKTNFLFYMNLINFIKIVFKRILARIDPDDDLIIPSINNSIKLLKNEIGILRSLHIALFYWRHNKKINQRRRELNP